MRRIDAASRPLEPEAGAVVSVRVRFAEDGPPYTYVLFHSPSGPWYVTGHEEKLAWEELWLSFTGLLLDGPVQVLAPARELAW